jgi:hypothetical protein
LLAGQQVEFTEWLVPCDIPGRHSDRGMWEQGREGTAGTGMASITCLRLVGVAFASLFVLIGIIIQLVAVRSASATLAPPHCKLPI